MDDREDAQKEADGGADREPEQKNPEPEWREIRERWFQLIHKEGWNPNFLIGIGTGLLLIFVAAFLSTKGQIVVGWLGTIILVSVAFGLLYRAADSPKPVPPGPSNEELKSQAALWVFKMRELQKKFDGEHRAQMDRHFTELLAYPEGPSKSPEGQALFEKRSREISDLNNRQRGEFAFIRPDIALLKDRLLARLPKQPDTMNSRTARMLLDDGFLAGAHPLDGTADYIAYLAAQLK